MDENSGKIPEKYTITNVDTIKYLLTKEAKKELKSWAAKFTGAFIVILSFIGILTYRGLMIYQQAIVDRVSKQIDSEVEMVLTDVKQDIESRIKQSYDETNIDVIVDDLIKEDAKALIANQLREEINPIIKKIEKDQKRFSEIVSIHELAMSAESGDRVAFEKLEQITLSPQHKDSLFAYGICYKIYKGYNTGGYDVRRFPDTLTDARVIEFLTSESFINREIAVFTVEERKLYNQVSTLISMLRTEPHLDVVAALTWMLNDMLDVRLEVLEEDAVDKFSQIWAEKKDELLREGQE